MTVEHDHDKWAIISVLTRYARAVDTRNWDLYKSCFTPDAIIDYSASGGVRAERDQATAWVSAAIEPFTMSQHLVMNHEIEIDGDSARSYADFYNPMGRPDGKGGLALLFVGGAYVDRLERRAGEWFIVERTEKMYWFTGTWPEDVAL
jgi:3-phenylpropionate/cinnamic acid dioxygenase small subunit